MRDVALGVLVQKPRTPVSTRIKNLTLAAIAGQAGCITLIIVLSALFIGLWFDSQLGQRGPCTAGMLIISVPFSLYAMLRLTLSALNRIVPQPVQKRRKPKDNYEEV